MTKELDALKKEAQKLTAELEEFGKHIYSLEDEVQGVWQLEDGVPYYLINASGEVSRVIADDPALDRAVFAQGNAFRTRQEAEREVNRRSVIQRLRIAAGGFKPDWSDTEQEKYYLYFNHGDKIGWCVTRCWSYYQIISLPAFKDEATLRRAIEEIGDDMKYLLDEEVDDA